jgi:hypothetical protein
MSVLRPLLSRRGRLALLAISLLLIGALVAAPGVSGAKAAVKQFTANFLAPNTTYSGGVSGNWTLEVKNCGTPIAAPCTASSTIGLGQVRITVPEAFRPGFTLGVVSASPSRNWTVSSYDSSTGILVARAVTGSDKLASGEFVDIAFSATPTGCSTTSPAFMTAGWGSLPTTPDSEPFSIVGSQPSLTGLGCTFTDPSGQTETISGNFQGQVNVTFGGDLINCSFDPTFGDQWSDFHLPIQVFITPGAGFVPNGPKIATSRFTPLVPGDSSSYLICYASLTTFSTRGGTAPHVVNIGGTNFFVGILPNCYDPVSGSTRPEPCTSEQFLDLATNEIVISTRIPPADPGKH